MTVKITNKLDEYIKRHSSTEPDNNQLINSRVQKRFDKPLLDDLGLEQKKRQVPAQNQKRDIRSVSRLELLTPLGRSLNSAGDVDNWANLVTEICSNSLNLDGAFLSISDDDGQITHEQAYGLLEDRLDLQKQLSRWLRQTKEVDLFPSRAPEEIGISFAIPLQNSNQIRGFLCLGNKKNNESFIPEDMSFIHCYSQQIVSSLENVKTQARIGKWANELCRVYDELKKVHGCLEESETHMDLLFSNSIKGLVNALELHDRYMVGHSERVATHTKMLSNDIISDENERKRIILAAKLHDLGKIAIPDQILRKKGKLEAEEIAEIQLHPIRSVELAKSLSFLDGELPAIKHHHEWWNGRGYPEGLKGEQIPIGARMLAVCDAYDAMTSTRPYREAIGTKEALRVLEEGANEQWDPELVSYFIKSLHKSKLQ